MPRKRRHNQTKYTPEELDLEEIRSASDSSGNNVTITRGKPWKQMRPSVEGHESNNPTSSSEDALVDQASKTRAKRRRQRREAKKQGRGLLWSIDSKGGREEKAHKVALHDYGDELFHPGKIPVHSTREMRELGVEGVMKEVLPDPNRDPALGFNSNIEKFPRTVNRTDGKWGKRELPTMGLEISSSSSERSHDIEPPTGTPLTGGTGEDELFDLLSSSIDTDSHETALTPLAPPPETFPTSPSAISGVNQWLQAISSSTPETDSVGTRWAGGREPQPVGRGSASVSRPRTSISTAMSAEEHNQTRRSLLTPTAESSSTLANEALQRALLLKDRYGASDLIRAGKINEAFILRTNRLPSEQDEGSLFVGDSAFSHFDDHSPSYERRRGHRERESQEIYKELRSIVAQLAAERRGRVKPALSTTLGSPDRIAVADTSRSGTSPPKAQSGKGLHESVAISPSHFSPPSHRSRERRAPPPNRVSPRERRYQNSRFGNRKGGQVRGWEENKAATEGKMPGGGDDGGIGHGGGDWISERTAKRRRKGQPYGSAAEQLSPVASWRAQGRADEENNQGESTGWGQAMDASASHSNAWMTSSQQRGLKK